MLIDQPIDRITRVRLAMLDELKMFDLRLRFTAGAIILNELRPWYSPARWVEHRRLRREQRIMQQERDSVAKRIWNSYTHESMMIAERRQQLR